MLEYPLAIHLPVSELALVFMTLSPSEFTSSLHNVLLEFALESAAIREHCKPLSVLHVSIPVAFVFCQDTIHIARAIVDLQAIAVSHHLVCF